MAVLKYELIAETLRQRIADGEFAPEDLLPSQRDLCAQWDVSRATVIKAYDILVQDGLVVARQGQGFRVVPAPLARAAGGRKTGTTRAGTGRAFRILGTPVREAPPGRIASALGITDGQVALRRDRLMQLADGSPLTVVQAWFPLDIADQCPRLEGTKQIVEGTTRYIQRMTGRSPARGTDIKTARLGTAEEAVLLEREGPFAVQTVLHTASDMDGRTVVVEYGVTPGDLWEETDTYAMGTSR
ncbi:GntR family transcriptional regulator [Streptomyces sp. NPDC006632]|uniref:GntR family transcriptional regulator n=1 Tax=Streptomyces sp. NPDC006632 TaxID=3157182 RepID=UPI0033B2E3F1